MKICLISLDITWHHVTLCEVVFSRFLNRFKFIHIKGEITLNLTSSYGNLKCLSFSKRKKRRLYFVKLTTSTTSAMISHPAHHLSRPKESEHKIRRSVSALNQWHSKLTSRVLFDAAWTHIHLKKNVCVLLDGCLSSFVISNKYINHRGKRISSHLMADKTVCEINFLLTPLIYCTGTFINSKMIQIYHTWHGCNDMLFSTYLICSYEVDWPDIKWTINQRDHLSPVSVMKSEHLEMARMICSLEHFANKINILVYHCWQSLTVW